MCSNSRADGMLYSESAKSKERRRRHPEKPSSKNISVGESIGACEKPHPSYWSRMVAVHIHVFGRPPLGMTFGTPNISGSQFYLSSPTSDDSPYDSGQEKVLTKET